LALLDIVTIAAASGGPPAEEGEEGKRGREGTQRRPARDAAAAALACPIVEEVVYRGYLQPALAGSWGPRLGAVATAVLFAAIHFVPVEFPGLLAFALVLGWARQRTGRLGLPIVTHLAFNATGLVLVALR